MFLEDKDSLLINLLIWLVESHTHHSHERIHQISGKGKKMEGEVSRGEALLTTESILYESFIK